MGGGGGVASGLSERMSGAGSCGVMNGTGDMWALKPDDSIVSPSFLFQVCGEFLLTDSLELLFQKGVPKVSKGVDIFNRVLIQTFTGI